MKRLNEEDQPRLATGCASRRTVRAKHAVGGKHMDVRVECDKIAESLNEKNQPRAAFDLGAEIGVGQQPFHYMAEFPEEPPLVRNDAFQSIFIP